ncbi:MAG: hydroxymethylbilane synthase [Armatimonadota bacterium]
MSKGTIRLGTRGSLLALTQSRWVARQLEELGYTVPLEIIKTTGDRITDRIFTPGDGKGVFVAELERALQQGDIDLAVHSMKDLPGEMPDDLTLAAVPPREDPRDVLVGRTAPTLAALPAHAVIGTSSLRRRAQLLAARKGLKIADLRGNIDTRLRKLDEGQYDAICLAAAGLHRLGLQERITEYLSLDMMVPPVGQGALALQTRADDARVINALQPLHDENTHRAVRAERKVLAALGGGCSIPLGVLGKADGEKLTLTAVLCSTDGSKVIREELAGSWTPEEIGVAMAELLLTQAQEQGIDIS